MDSEREKSMERTLFIFQGQDVGIEVYASSRVEADKKVKELGYDGPLKLRLITQNIDCPKCGCKATECNYDL